MDDGKSDSGSVMKPAVRSPDDILKAAHESAVGKLSEEIEKGSPYAGIGAKRKAKAGTPGYGADGRKLPKAYKRGFIYDPDNPMHEHGGSSEAKAEMNRIWALMKTPEGIKKIKKRIRTDKKWSELTKYALMNIVQLALDVEGNVALSANKLILQVMGDLRLDDRGAEFDWGMKFVRAPGRTKKDVDAAVDSAVRGGVDSEEVSELAGVQAGRFDALENETEED